MQSMQYTLYGPLHSACNAQCTSALSHGVGRCSEEVIKEGIHLLLDPHLDLRRSGPRSLEERDGAIHCGAWNTPFSVLCIAHVTRSAGMLSLRVGDCSQEVQKGVIKGVPHIDTLETC